MQGLREGHLVFYTGVVSGNTPVPTPTPTPAPTPAPAPSPSSAKPQTITLTAPVVTGTASPASQGVVLAPDTMIKAGKAVTFKGIAPGFSNVMVILPNSAWLGTTRDANGAFSIDLDLTPFSTGPLPVRIFGWYDSNGEQQVTFDVTILLDNPAKPLVVPGPPAQVAGMKLLAFDDFAGPSINPAWGFGCRPDKSQWGSGCHFTEVGEPEFKESYSIVMPHMLRLRAKYRPDYQAPNGWDQKWTSGLLCSARPDGKNLATFRKGAIEMRCLLPLMKGSWPASWGLNVGNDETGADVHGSVEIDGSEFYNQNINSSYYVNINSINHQGSDKEADPISFPQAPDGLVYSPIIPDMCFVMRTVLHVIGQDTFITYIDGVKIVERRIPRSATVGDFYWMINMALSNGANHGDWPIGTPPGGIADMFIHYIRFWKAA